MTVRREEHAGHARVDGQTRHRAPQPREPGAAVASLLQRPELGQQRPAVAHGAAVGCVEEREVLDVAEVERRHLQQHRREVRAQDLRVGELGATVVVLLGVEPDADAVGHAAAAPRALGGARAGDRLDRQPLDLEALAVARDAGVAGVDDVPDAGDGQRRLGDVRGQYDAPSRVRREDLRLVLRGEPAVERQDLRLAPAQALEVGGGVTDLPLAGQEDEYVALAWQLTDGGLDAVEHPVVRVGQRPVAHLDRVGTPAHLDDRRTVEHLREALDVDRRRRDHDLEVGSAGEELLEVPQQEVDGEAALVGLVDDHRVVARQVAVVVDLAEQQPVGDQPDLGAVAGAVVEADGVADLPPELDLALLGDAGRDRPGGDASRLRVHDALAAEQTRDLRQLGGLARPGLAGDDHDLVVAQRRGDVVGAVGDGQPRRDLHLHRRRRHRSPSRSPRTRTPTNANTSSSVWATTRGASRRVRWYQ